jgi:hypothetical protein
VYTFDGVILDEIGESSQLTAKITFTRLNHAPVAADQAETTAEDTAKAITLSGTDVDGDALTYAIVDGPTHGTLSVTAPDVTYTPGANYYGPDSFTFKVNDGTVDSSPATVSITVTPVDDPPVAIAQAVTTPEDTARAITLTGSDVEGSALTYAVVTPPAHGTLTGPAPNLTYTPALNYNGADSFTFKVNDGTVDSSPATVSITVTPVNDPPVASNGSYTTLGTQSVTGTLVATDVDSPTLTFRIVNGPAKGTVVLDSSTGVFTYTPRSGVKTASDNFTFKAFDGQASSNNGKITISLR